MRDVPGLASHGAAAQHRRNEQTSSPEMKAAATLDQKPAHKRDVRDIKHAAIPASTRQSKRLLRYPSRRRAANYFHSARITGINEFTRCFCAANRQAKQRRHNRGRRLTKWLLGHPASMVAASIGGRGGRSSIEEAVCGNGEGVSTGADAMECRAFSVS